MQPNQNILMQLATTICCKHFWWLLLVSSTSLRVKAQIASTRVRRITYHLTAFISVNAESALLLEELLFLCFSSSICFSVVNQSHIFLCYRNHSTSKQFFSAIYNFLNIQLFLQMISSNEWRECSTTLKLQPL